MFSFISVDRTRGLGRGGRIWYSAGGEDHDSEGAADGLFNDDGPEEFETIVLRALVKGKTWNPPTSASVSSTLDTSPVFGTLPILSNLSCASFYLFPFVSAFWGFAWCY